MNPSAGTDTGGSLPVIALVGRPNVGKSTLFNFLTRTRDALVADVPGLTRDRQYGFGKVGPRDYLVVDTGGLSGEKEGIAALMARQTQAALDEADVILFMVDSREGLMPSDTDVAEMLRRLNKPLHLVVNKAEGLQSDVAGAEFHALGIGEPLAISSAHGHNITALMDFVLEGFPDKKADLDSLYPGIRVAIVGRPNVGKSTLINRFLGEERLVTFDQPGTTRDSVFIPFTRGKQDYTLIDTAGVRRRARVTDLVEKFSIIKTLKAIDDAHVVIALIDGQDGVTDQDAGLLGLIVQRGRALVLAVNKWDGLTEDQKQNVHRGIELRLPFVEFASLHFISALHGTGVGKLLGEVRKAYAAAMRDLSTPELTACLEDAVSRHQHPLIGGRRIKLRYAHQGGRNPPIIVIHGNQTSKVKTSYQRYLINHFRKVFRLQGTPIRIELRSGKNPYAGKRNKLTPRQEKKRERLRKRTRKR
ncbi:MAG: ribosome biogenesis GTPase Der [Gammaproteobacteria bacterium]|nr:ribosome biogenesis GTPase Der [Gammaproteobacteria bacterium]